MDLRNIIDAAGELCEWIKTPDGDSLDKVGEELFAKIRDLRDEIIHL